jgi:hypothetical protein
VLAQHGQMLGETLRRLPEPGLSVLYENAL